MGNSPLVMTRRCCPFHAILFLVCFVSIACAADQSQYIAADSPLVQITGRFLFSENSTVTFDWPCVSVTFSVSGCAAVSLQMDAGHNDFDVVVSGSFASTVKGQGEGIYTVASNLNPGVVSDIVVIKRTEASGWLDSYVPVMKLAPVTLHSVVLCHAGILHPPISSVTSGRKLEVFSDSDANGFGIEGSVGLCEGRFERYENCRLSWSSLLAASLDAELHVEAWSGKGLIRNAADVFPVHAEVPMPDYWNSTIAAHLAETSWNFSSWVPDVVIVLLGSNDYTNLKALQPTREQFIASYVTLLRRVRAAYPDLARTKIAALCGGYGEAYVPMCAYTPPAVSAFADAATTYIEVPEAQLLHYPQDYGCLDHRNVQGQAKIAAWLAPRILALIS